MELTALNTRASPPSSGYHVTVVGIGYRNAARRAMGSALRLDGARWGTGANWVVDRCTRAVERAGGHDGVQP